jgi:hypothetical protein
LARDYPQYRWVAVLVELFIMVSITVSFVTIGGALHHTRQSAPLTFLLDLLTFLLHYI